MLIPKRSIRYAHAAVVYRPVAAFAFVCAVATALVAITVPPLAPSFGQLFQQTTDLLASVSSSIPRRSYVAFGATLLALVLILWPTLVGPLTSLRITISQRFGGGIQRRIVPGATWLIVANLVAAGLIAYGSWLAASIWASGDATDGVRQVDLAKAGAVVLGVLSIVLSSPLWFRPAQSLRPILLPAFLLLVMVVIGLGLLAADLSEPSTSVEKAYLFGIAAGLGAVLTASLKWAFDMISVQREHLRSLNSTMIQRVDDMVKGEYSGLIRRAWDARQVLTELDRLRNLPDQFSFEEESESAMLRATFALAQFMHQERQLFRRWGAIFLASQTREGRVQTCLAAFHSLLSLSLEESAALTDAMEISANRPPSGGPTPLTTYEWFVLEAERGTTTKRALATIRRRLNRERVLVGLMTALDEIRLELRWGIDEIYVGWYSDGRQVRVSELYRFNELAIRSRAARVADQLEVLVRALKPGPSDLYDQIDALRFHLRNSIRASDPLAVFLVLEGQLRELLEQLELRLGKQHPNLGKSCATILHHLEVWEGDATRLPPSWGEREHYVVRGLEDA